MIDISRSSSYPRSALLPWFIIHRISPILLLFFSLFTSLTPTLFVNPISADIHLFVIEDSTTIDTSILPKWDDFSLFPGKITDMIDQYHIEEIWCVCGPGAFTRMRIITLALNTLKLSRWIRLKGCHFFELIDTEIPILKANEREYITRVWHGEIALLPKEELPSGSYKWYGEKNDFTDAKVFIQYSEDIRNIDTLFRSLPLSESLSPIYLKDPHITWSKKNTSHS